MNNEIEIRERLDNVREQLLALEEDIQNLQMFPSSQNNEEEIRIRLSNVSEQVLELEKEIQNPGKTASSQHDDASQIALGWFHNFSKNTVVKTVYSKIDNNKQGTYFGRMGVASSLASPAAGSDPSSFQVSIQTSF